MHHAERCHSIDMKKLFWKLKIVLDCNKGMRDAELFFPEFDRMNLENNYTKILVQEEETSPLECLPLHFQ
jgi:hypothetical protein